jgi:membrane protein required for colicin V production
LHLTLFDIIALLILSVSTLVGFVRGALREVSTIIAFAVAVAVAILALPFTGHVARAAVQPSWAANAVAVLVVFLAVYILVRVVAAALTRGVHSTQTLGMVDRVIGGGFGLIRGLVLLGLLYLAFNLAPPPSGVPGWMAQARLYPLSATCARTLLALAPKGSALAGKITPAIAHAVAGSSSEPAASSAIGQSDDKGYSHAARQGLDDAVEKSR